MWPFAPWDVREPAPVIAEAVTRCRAVAGDVLMVLLPRADADDGEQEVADALRIHHGTLPDRWAASDLWGEHALRLVDERPWDGSGWRPPQFVLVTIVCRQGRVVPGPDELFWMMARRYSNHLGDAFDGDVYLVTEHGWTGCHDERAGFTPFLGSGPRHLHAVDDADHDADRRGRTGAA